MTETRGMLATECESIWRAALGRTAAVRLVSEALSARPPPGPVRVLALGKAAIPMASAAAGALGAEAQDVLCVAPDSAAGDAPPGARLLRGSHPRPDAGSASAGQAILEWARRGGGRPALVLVSGGGSALAVAPAGVSLEEKIAAVEALSRAGATIQQLNALRKHLSALKGGRLGALLAPAPVRVLVLSDVPGDDLSTIASGPLAPDPTTFADVLAALDAAGATVPPAVRARLEAGARGEIEETPKPGDVRLASVEHQLLAGPTELARAAASAARALGFAAEADPSPLAGDVSEVAERAAAWAHAWAGRGRRLLALGGEPTIRIPSGAAAPDGGRAQHLALLAAKRIAGLPAAVLAAGSDGRDGPTDQAGAVVDGGTAARAKALGIDLDAALSEARSGPACIALGVAIPRRETGTHLCDLVIVAV